ncbi:AlbA family DNA-binding domain-containing protein [Cellulomonas chengniuliangii]|uniref:AlbA family DNA-binding domain-containing protein n=1 Tax=Cellulomonas chengniuliangii TaxID=2968084 RepID=UPI001D0F0873|nr:ATP-binding protein [Cellulomonas chengniuliangii]MCC2318385.1 ATP-binding protein [Cellulomonas chengniuliangii]
MPLFTSLHRALGRPPGPIDDELLDSAVGQGVAETDDLDWKSELPPSRDLSQTDFPKDVAAMANRGGGVIVYGVTEKQKRATGRADVGVLSEIHERTLRSAAVTAISPPVLGLTIVRVGEREPRAVAVIVPASEDGPHLIYKNDFFGAPIRNDADTAWMKESQIEAAYRTRLEARRHAAETLDRLYAESAAGRTDDENAWLIAVAHPRIPAVTMPRPSRDAAREAFSRARDVARRLTSGRGDNGPLASVDLLNPRPGLRRWQAVNAATQERSRWHESWVSLHHDGAVTLAARVGAWPGVTGEFEPGWMVDSAVIEQAVADLMGLVRAAGEARTLSEYDVRVGVEWRPPTPLMIRTVENGGNYPFTGSSVPLPRYAAVDITVLADDDATGFQQQTYDLARDCVNQGGITYTRLIEAIDGVSEQ